MKNLITRTEDGGYYAIKGFAYQFDKVILEILGSANENKAIKIEHIQDVDNDDFVMQIKYKEKQDFSDSKIKVPVIQLIEEFERDRSKRYILYCYFRNKSQEIKSITIDELNSILSISKGGSRKVKHINEVIESINSDLRIEFVNNFKIIFAPDFDSQFDLILNELEKIGSISKDTAVFYYSNIIYYLNRIVLSNTRKENRKCTKKELLDFIRATKKFIFDSSYKYYKGEKEYFGFLREKFVTPRPNQRNLIVVGHSEINPSISIGKLVADITENYFKKATYDIIPITFVMPDEWVTEIKKYLIDCNLLFNDGYESIKFNEKIFDSPAIITRKNSKNGYRATELLHDISYKLRILSLTNFISIADKDRFQMAYFFDNEVIKGIQNTSYLKIDNVNSKQIKELFKA